MSANALPTVSAAVDSWEPSWSWIAVAVLFAALLLAAVIGLWAGFLTTVRGAVDSALQAINHNPQELLPTQDLDSVYLENSNFYIFSREAFFATSTRITADTAVFEMDSVEAVDIDEEADFEMAELLYAGDAKRLSPPHQ